MERTIQWLHNASLVLNVASIVVLAVSFVETAFLSIAVLMLLMAGLFWLRKKMLTLRLLSMPKRSTRREHSLSAGSRHFPA